MFGEGDGAPFGTVRGSGSGGANTVIAQCFQVAVMLQFGLRTPVKTASVFLYGAYKQEVF